MICWLFGVELVGVIRFSSNKINIVVIVVIVIGRVIFIFF